MTASSHDSRSSLRSLYCFSEAGRRTERLFNGAANHASKRAPLPCQCVNDSGGLQPFPSLAHTSLSLDTPSCGFPSLSSTLDATLRRLLGKSSVARRPQRKKPEFYVSVSQVAMLPDRVDISL
jgi:hypothetical protein